MKKNVLTILAITGTFSVCYLLYKYKRRIIKKCNFKKSLGTTPDMNSVEKENSVYEVFVNDSSLSLVRVDSGEENFYGDRFNKSSITDNKNTEERNNLIKDSVPALYSLDFEVNENILSAEACENNLVELNMPRILNSSNNSGIFTTYIGHEDDLKFLELNVEDDSAFTFLSPSIISSFESINEMSKEEISKNSKPQNGDFSNKTLVQPLEELSINDLNRNVNTDNGTFYSTSNADNNIEGKQYSLNKCKCNKKKNFPLIFNGVSDTSSVISHTEFNGTNHLLNLNLNAETNGFKYSNPLLVSDIEKNCQTLKVLSEPILHNEEKQESSSSVDKSTKRKKRRKKKKNNDYNSSSGASSSESNGSSTTAIDEMLTTGQIVYYNSSCYSSLGVNLDNNNEGTSILEINNSNGDVSVLKNNNNVDIPVLENYNEDTLVMENNIEDIPVLENNNEEVLNLQNNNNEDLPVSGENNKYEPVLENYNEGLSGLKEVYSISEGSNICKKTIASVLNDYKDIPVSENNEYKPVLENNEGLSVLKEAYSISEGSNIYERVDDAVSNVLNDYHPVSETNRSSLCSPESLYPQIPILEPHSLAINSEPLYPSVLPSELNSLAGDSIQYAPIMEQFPQYGLLPRYNFEISQLLAGRLIGKNGVHVKKVNETADVKCFVNDHKTNEELSVCTIEGEHDAIKFALEIIRERFPIEDYPDLTLEDKSYIPPNQFVYPPVAYTCKLDQVPIPVATSFEVRVSSIESVGDIWIQQHHNRLFQKYILMTNRLTELYGDGSTLPKLSYPIEENTLAVCKLNKKWYRCLLPETNTDVARVKLVDVGGYLDLPVKYLRRPDNAACMSRYLQASLHHLYGLEPPSGSKVYPKEGERFLIKLLKSLKKDETIIATVPAFINETSEKLLNLYIGNKESKTLGLYINKLLVDQGFASWGDYVYDSEKN